MNFAFLMARVKRKLGASEAIIKYYRKTGMQIGENCKIYSDINTTENYLVHIGDDVTVSTGVKLITHDNSVIKFSDKGTDVFGTISIGDHSFIGLNAIIMYGVTLHPYTVVAAGAVVTKSTTEEGVILGGNPARVIGKAVDFMNKVEDKVINTPQLSKSEKKSVLSDESNLIRR